MSKLTAEEIKVFDKVEAIKESPNLCMKVPLVRGRYEMIAERELSELESEVRRAITRVNNMKLLTSKTKTKRIQTIKDCFEDLIDEVDVHLKEQMSAYEEMLSKKEKEWKAILKVRYTKVPNKEDLIYNQAAFLGFIKEMSAKYGTEFSEMYVRDDPWDEDNHGVTRVKDLSGFGARYGAYREMSDFGEWTNFPDGLVALLSSINLSVWILIHEGALDKSEIPPRDWEIRWKRSKKNFMLSLDKI